MIAKVSLLSIILLVLSCSTHSDSSRTKKSEHLANKQIAFSQKYDCINIKPNCLKQINEITYNDLKIKVETLKSKNTVVNSAFFPVLLPVLEQIIFFSDNKKIIAIDSLNHETINYYNSNKEIVKASDSYIYNVYFINKSKFGRLIVFAGVSQTKEKKIYEFEMVYSSNGRLLFDGYNIRNPFKYESFVKELELKKKGLDKNSEIEILFEDCQ
jgi:hypothetical protein